MKTKFNYCGLFLTEESRKKLWKYVPVLPSGARVYLEHCTVIHAAQLHGNGSTFDWCLRHEGETISVKVKGVGISDKAFALAVDFPISVNNVPHITIATMGAGRPKDSNDIKDWRNIYPIDVDVVVKNVYVDADSLPMEWDVPRVDKNPNPFIHKGNINIKGSSLDDLFEYLITEKPNIDHTYIKDEVGHSYIVSMEYPSLEILRSWYWARKKGEVRKTPKGVEYLDDFGILVKRGDFYYYITTLK